MSIRLNQIAGIVTLFVHFDNLTQQTGVESVFAFMTSQFGSVF